MATLSFRCGHVFPKQQEHFESVCTDGRTRDPRILGTIAGNLCTIHAILLSNRESGYL